MILNRSVSSLQRPVSQQQHDSETVIARLDRAMHSNNRAWQNQPFPTGSSNQARWIRMRGRLGRG